MSVNETTKLVKYLFIISTRVAVKVQFVESNVCLCILMGHVICT